MKFEPFIFFLSVVLPCFGQEKTILMSTDFPCPPSLKIKQFSDIQTNIPGYNPDNEECFKVVVNRNFNYKVKPNGNSNWTWNWKLGKLNGNSVTNFWTISPLLENLHESDGTAKITNLPLLNSDFGPSNGVIEVTATTSGGDNINVISSNAPTFKCGVLNTSPLVDEIVDVYFEKDGINANNLPNWFFYWKQIPLITTLLNEIEGIKLYDSTSCSFNPNKTPPIIELVYEPNFQYTPGQLSTYGKSYFNASNLKTYNPIPGCQNPSNQDNHIYGENYKPEGLKIKIGPGCGQTMAKHSNPDQSLLGIHVFYSNVAHEVTHAKIFCENWGDGYDKFLDSDHDGYKDSWEEEVNLTIQHPGCMFHVGFPDTYGDYNDLDFTNCSNKTAGTAYEERRCRDVELQLEAHLNDINVFDWSFDPQNLIQGKQW